MPGFHDKVVFHYNMKTTEEYGEFPEKKKQKNPEGKHILFGNQHKKDDPDDCHFVNDRIKNFSQIGFLIEAPCEVPIQTVRENGQADKNTQQNDGGNEAM